jgi:plastocyanin/Icc-related predicted phosphoesterase
MKIDNRNFLKIICVCCILLFAGPGISAGANNKNKAAGDFFFIQVSDTHVGFSGPAINPDPSGSLKKVIAAINSLALQPDFIVFTGDLTHTTDDPKERRKRLAEFKVVTKELKVKNVRFLPGEHDAALDKGKAYREYFGKSYYTFDHKGIHFIVIDNVSDPTSSIGKEQLRWLGAVLKKYKKDSRIVILTHRPLFDLYPQWDWWTRDGAQAIEMLKPYKNVAVFYGHIHQENHQTAGVIGHHAAMSTIFPLPAPGSVPKKAPVPWDPAKPYNGLGYRSIAVGMKDAGYKLTEYSISASEEKADPVIKVSAKKFEFIPNTITLKKGIAAVLELTSLDVMHGFNCPDLGVRTDINPGTVSRVKITPQKAGTFQFFCDVFCGEGHENMTGKIIVEE